MSRHLSIKDQRPRVHVAADKPSGNLTSVRYNTNGRYAKTCHNGAVIASTSSYCCDLVQDACASEDTFDDSNTYYECFPDHGYQANIKKPERTDCMYSDDSSSTKLPYYEYEDLPSRRHSRYAQSDRSYSKKAQQLCKENKLKPILIQSNGRKIYPNPSEAFDGFCQEERYTRAVINILKIIITICYFSDASLKTPWRYLSNSLWGGNFSKLKVPGALRSPAPSYTVAVATARRSRTSAITSCKSPSPWES